jgi:hypothetical protein
MGGSKRLSRIKASARFAGVVTPQIGFMRHKITAKTFLPPYGEHPIAPSRFNRDSLFHYEASAFAGAVRQETFN